MYRVKIASKIRMEHRLKMILAAFALAVVLPCIFGDFGLILKAVTATHSRLLSALFGITGILLSLLVYPPLKMGAEKYFLFCSEKKPFTFSIFFDYFTRANYFHAFKAVWFIVLYKASRLMFFLFPFTGMFIVIYSSFKSEQIPFLSLVIIALSDAVLLATGSIFYFVRNSDTLFYYPVALTNETASPAEILMHSKRLTHGKNGKICLFKLSFLPWLLAVIPVFPAFYAWGYYRQSLTEMAVHFEAV